MSKPLDTSISAKYSVKKNNLPLLLLVYIWLLAGCTSPFSPSAGGKIDKPVVNIAQGKTDAAMRASDAASAQATTAQTELLSKLKSNIISARQANDAQPPSIPTTKVAGELGVADSRLTGVTPDPVELAAAAQRALLVEQGKTADAAAAYAAAKNEAAIKSAELKRLEEESARARQERDAARASEKLVYEKFASEMEKNRSDFEAQLAKVKLAADLRVADARNETMREQARWLNLAGAACVVLCALGIGFGGLAGIKMTWPFGLIALFCFGLAQIVSLWWFKWAILVAAIISIGVALWWVWKHFQEGNLRAAAEQKAVSASNVLKQLVPALDTAYDNAGADLKQLLDATVFDTLSKAMDKSDKTLVKQIRAQLP